MSCAPAPLPVRSAAEVIAAYVDAFNRADADALAAQFTPDARIHGILGWGDLAVARPIWQMLFASFGIQLHVEDLIVSGDTVAVRFTERGVFQAQFRGAEPTHRRYELPAMEWFTLRDGLICRRWGVRDMNALFRQVGLPGT